MIKTILTAQDLINRTSIKSGTSPNVICPHLECERDIMTKCFGELYDTMLADAVDTKAEQSKNEEWESGNTYSTGEKVMHCGLCYEKINEEETSEEPDCSDSWKECPRFTEPCFNLIWEELCSYLSWSVYLDAIPFLHIAGNEGGLTVPETTKMGREGADKEWYNIYCNSIYKKCARKLKTLKDKIIRICEKGKCSIFQELDFVSQVCDTGCGDTKEEDERIAWRRGEH